MAEAAEVAAAIVTDVQAEKAAAAPKPRKPRTKRPNYNLIHKDPLPITVQPLPQIILHNPLSVVQFLYSYLFTASQSHPDPPYIGLFDLDSSSVHIWDERSRDALWRQGFFGKGNLSRSEPTWLTRTKRKVGVIGANENLTSEEYTERRRIERREFKKERERLEKERIARVLAQEGKLQRAPDGTENALDVAKEEPIVESPPAPTPQDSPEKEERVAMEIQDQEHLQLTLEEAFFLSYGLGSLQVLDSSTKKPIPPSQQLSLFRRYSYYPPKSVNELQPDDPFIVSYVVYHHFRSLGWVVKSGIKFSVDYLLYNRGPAFTHAEFAIVILPSYEHPSWANHPKKLEVEANRSWHWLHAVNRVCSQVKKTVILVYVDIPPPGSEKGADAVDKIIKRYKVREVCVRRWLPARNRD